MVNCSLQGVTSVFRLLKGSDLPSPPRNTVQRPKWKMALKSSDGYLVLRLKQHRGYRNEYVTGGDQPDL
jgi:hypothetical protein